MSIIPAREAAVPPKEQLARQTGKPLWLFSGCLKRYELTGLGYITIGQSGTRRTQKSLDKGYRRGWPYEESCPFQATFYTPQNHGCVSDIDMSAFRLILIGLE